MVQKSLRSVLMQIADFRKATPDVIRGMMRVAPSLKHCFNSTLVQHLIKHLSSVVARRFWMVQEGACDWEAPCLLIRLCSMVPCAHTDVNQILKAALKPLHRPAHLYSERLPEESHPFIDALVPCVMRYPLESLAFLLDQIATSTSLPGWYETAV